jgi:hypothetical protein
MQIRPSTTIVALVAMMLVNPFIEAIGETSSDGRVIATAKSSRADLAQLEAPIGHRQPTLDDLPEWLREEEEPSAGASAIQAPRSAQNVRYNIYCHTHYPSTESRAPTHCLALPVTAGRQGAQPHGKVSQLRLPGLGRC